MESTSIATSSMKAFKFLTPPPPPAPQQSLTTKPKLITFTPTKPNKLSLIHCSTKPNTNTNNNIEDQDSTFNTKLDPQTPNPTNHIPLLPPPPFSPSSAGLVLGLGAENSWDSSEVGSPVVKRFLSDDEERWYMWYHGRSSSSPPSSSLDSIGLAVSSNGVHWERGPGAAQTSRDVGSVMTCGNDWWAFDTLGVRPSEVVIMSSSKVRASSSVYWMYYTGSFRSSEDEPERAHDKSLPGLAMSQDGRHWARIEGEHHSGALLDVGEWDSESIASPRVVFHGDGDLRMFYHSFDVGLGKFCVGVARSRDGMRWVKLGKVAFRGGGQSGNFDELGCLNAHVVRMRDGKYLMGYEGVGPDGERSIGLGVSEDGLRDWAMVQDKAVLRAQEDGWDQGGVGSPCLVQMEGEEDEWRLYYRGVGSEGRTGIGLATSCGSDLTRFRRWAGFHL